MKALEGSEACCAPIAGHRGGGRTRWPCPDSVDRLANALGLSDAERPEFVAAAGRRSGHDTGSTRHHAVQAYVPQLLPALVPAIVGRPVS